MPAREIKRSRVKNTGRFATVKSSRSQDVESLLEMDFLTLLEFDKRVARFSAQPITLCWIDANKCERHYTPDVVVQYNHLAYHDDPSTKTALFEVKPRAIIRRDWAELKPKFRAAINWSNINGCHFRIVTEKEIQTPYLENARFLLRFKGKHAPNNGELDAHCQMSIRETLYRIKTTTPRALLNEITSFESHQAELLPWIWYLINCDLIGCDMNQRITMTSPIWTLENASTLRLGNT